MYDLKKPWYLEHGNLELYMPYLEVDLWTQEQNHMRYIELYKISRSIEFTCSTRPSRRPHVTFN